MTKAEAIQYHKDQLLKIIMSFNPDFPLGAGMVAQIKHHREMIEELENMI